jgi:hypothetical protein
LRQDRQRGLEGWRTLFGQFADGLGHAVHFEPAQHDDNGASGRIMFASARLSVLVEAKSTDAPMLGWSALGTAT